MKGKLKVIDFETHSCDACGEQFIVACESQLQEKLKNHACRPVRQNRKKERFQQLQEQRIALFVHDTTVNRIEAHNFDKLVKQGVLVNG